MANAESASVLHRISPLQWAAIAGCIIFAAICTSMDWQIAETGATTKLPLIVSMLTTLCGLGIVTGALQRYRQTRYLLIVFIGLSFLMPTVIELIRGTADFTGLSTFFKGKNPFSWSSARFTLAVLLVLSLLQAGTLTQVRRWRVAILLWSTLAMGAGSAAAVLIFIARLPGFNLPQIPLIKRPWELLCLGIFAFSLFMIRKAFREGSYSGGIAIVLKYFLYLSIAAQLIKAGSQTVFDSFDKLAHVMVAFSYAVPAAILWRQYLNNEEFPEKEQSTSGLIMIKPETIASVAFISLVAVSVVVTVYLGTADFNIDGGMPRTAFGLILGVLTLSLMGLGIVMFRLLRAATQAQEDLQQLNITLEQRVKDRTEELQKKAEELESTNQELDQFTYAASHDLQEPLRKVVSFGNLLEDHLKDDDKLDKSTSRYLEFMIGGSQRLQRLIQDLLALSRAGRNVLDPAITPLNKIVEESVSDLYQRIKETNAEIVKNELPEVFCDAVQVRQLIFNLIGNSLKYCEAETPRVEVTLDQSNGETIYGIKDNGIGIEKEYSDKVFGAFQRLHSRKEYEGSGIGLALCKKIVDRHNGRIWVESEPGQGSHFKFTLNLTEEDVKAEEEAEKKEAVE